MLRDLSQTLYRDPYLCGYLCTLLMFYWCVYFIDIGELTLIHDKINYRFLLNTNLLRKSYVQ